MAVFRKAITNSVCIFVGSQSRRDITPIIRAVSGTSDDILTRVPASISALTCAVESSVKKSLRASTPRINATDPHRIGAFGRILPDSSKIFCHRSSKAEARRATIHGYVANCSKLATVDANGCSARPIIVRLSSKSRSCNKSASGRSRKAPINKSIRPLRSISTSSRYDPSNTSTSTSGVDCSKFAKVAGSRSDRDNAMAPIESRPPASRVSSIAPANSDMAIMKRRASFAPGRVSSTSRPTLPTRDTPATRSRSRTALCKDGAEIPIAAAALEKPLLSARAVKPRT